MRYILLLITVIFFISCKRYVHYNDNPPNKKQSIILEEFYKKGTVEISFDTGFNNDSTLVFLGERKVFDSILSTDNTIGFADKIIIDSDLDKKVLLLVGGKKIRLKLDINYPIIAIDKVGGKYSIEYRKYYRSYR